MKLTGIGNPDSLRAYAAQDAGRKNTIKDEGNTIAQDSAEISHKAKEMHLYRSELDKLPTIRQDIVDNIKEKLLNGTYNADATVIATEIIKAGDLDKLV